MRNFWKEASFLPTLNMGAGWREGAEALAEMRLRLGQWSSTAGSRAADVVGRRANVRDTCEVVRNETLPAISETEYVTGISNCNPSPSEPRGNSGWKQGVSIIKQSSDRSHQ